MGQVSVTLDTELDRPVALKEIQDRHADDQVSRARFVAEAEITGKLEHPGTIPVYGLGHHADGRPYWAMRFIHGDSLKEAIDQFYRDEALRRDPGRTALRLRELLGRFSDACNAVAYAHSRGVLHRDLKPGKVMLGPFGETLVVDRGMAKPVGAPASAGPASAEPASAEPETDGPIRLSPPSGSRDETMPGMAMGTPGFMSPEQARGQLECLGARSDVYSLVATLYCILTGRAPFEAGELGAMLRAVQQGEFPRPRTVDRSIDASLEAVCLKAMARELEDRYTSARELAQDIGRWLADEPVTARREPFTGRARRWMRRHRTMVSSAAAVLVIGLAGLAGFATVISGKNRELDAKNAQLVGKNLELVQERHAAVEERNHARRSEAEARAVLEFFEGKVLAATRPEGLEGGLDKDVTDALPLLEETLERRKIKPGSDHPTTLTTMHNLARAYRDTGRLSDAPPLFEQTYELRKSRLGPDDPVTLATMSYLALAYREAGWLSKATPLQEDTLKLRKSRIGPRHLDTLISMNNLALDLSYAGRRSDAVILFEETLGLMKANLGLEHAETLNTMDTESSPLLSRIFGGVADAM